MTGTRRSFARERHPRLKLTMAAAAVAGFALLWAALGRGHRSGAEAPATSPPSSTATVAASPKASPTQTVPPATRTRVSRGS